MIVWPLWGYTPSAQFKHTQYTQCMGGTSARGPGFLPIPCDPNLLGKHQETALHCVLSRGCGKFQS